MGPRIIAAWMIIIGLVMLVIALAPSQVIGGLVVSGLMLAVVWAVVELINYYF